MAADSKTFTLKIDGTEKIFKDLAELQVQIKKTGKTEEDFFKTVTVVTKSADQATRSFIAQYKSGLNSLTKNFVSISNNAKEFSDKLEDGLSRATNAFGKMAESSKILSQQFGIGQGASEELAATFQKLQIVAAIGEAFKGLAVAINIASIAARFLYVALGPIGLLLIGIGLAISAVAAAFAFFGKGAKQIRQENIDSVKSNKALADSYRDLEQIDFEQTTALIINNNKKRTKSSEDLIKIQKEQLIADFNFTKEELAIFQSGNAELIEELAKNQDVQLKLRAEGAQDALTVLTDNSKKLIEIERDTENQKVKLQTATITNTTNLLSASLEASADYSAKQKNIVVSTIKEVATFVLALDEHTRLIFKERGIIFDNFQKLTLNDLTKYTKKIDDLITDHPDLKADLLNIQQQIKTQIIKANNEIATVIRQQRIRALNDETSLFQTRTELIETFNIKQLNLTKDIDNKIAVLKIQRGKDIDTIETDRQIKLLEASKKNSIIKLIEEENAALTNLFKQRQEIANAMLQRSFDQSNFYGNLDVEAQVIRLEEQASNQLKVLEKEENNIKYSYDERIKILKKANLTQADLSKSLKELNNINETNIEDSIEKRAKLEEETSTKVYNTRLTNINKTIEAIQRQLTEENRLRAIDNTKTQLASDEDIINMNQLTKSIGEQNKGLIDAGFNLGKINRNYDILKAAAKASAQEQINSLKRVSEEQIKLLTNQKSIDKERVKQLKDLQAERIADKKNLSETEQKSLDDSQNRLNTFENEKKNIEKKAANDTLKVNTDLTNNLKTLNTQRLDDLVSAFSKGLDSISSMANTISSVFSTYVTEANKQSQAQIDENQKRLDQVNANITLIDERLAATNAELTNLIALSDQADSGRRDAIIAQIHNEEDARNGLIAIKKQELAEAKRLENENKKLAADQAIREKQAANVALISSTIQSFAAAASAIASIAAQSAKQDFTFGIATVASIVAVTASVIGAITSALGAAKAIQFAKGGILEGPSHAQGGIMLNSSSGASYGEAEGGEIVLTKGVSKNPALLSVASSLNQMAGGNSLTTNSRFEDGGILPNTAAFSNQDNQLSGLLDTAMNLSERPIVVSVTDINLTNSRLKTIENKATI